MSEPDSDNHYRLDVQKRGLSSSTAMPEALALLSQEADWDERHCMVPPLWHEPSEMWRMNGQKQEEEDETG